VICASIPVGRIVIVVAGGLATLLVTEGGLDDRVHERWSALDVSDFKSKTGALSVFRRWG
jgi:hypothetical protein